MPRAFVLVLTAILVASCGGTAAPDRWARDAAIATFESAGFSGSDSPLQDGTPRWLGRGPNGSTAEVIGAPGTVRAISLTTVVNADGGRLTGTILGAFAPGAAAWVSDQITTHNGVDVDVSKDFDGASVRLQTVNATDGTIAVMTVTRT